MMPISQVIRDIEDGMRYLSHIRGGVAEYAQNHFNGNVPLATVDCSGPIITVTIQEQKQSATNVSVQVQALKIADGTYANPVHSETYKSLQELGTATAGHFSDAFAQAMLF
jgi:hypothetical protein